MTTSALFCLVMSIIWIAFISNTIIDLLQIFGFITTLPEALLALTIVSWANSLGDIAADVGMTKKGFPEMAITGCTAGPIFNVLVGIGLSTTLSILSSGDIMNQKIGFSIWKQEDSSKLNTDAMLPLVLILGQL
jgi:Ca2+/Na+ antiporter